MSKEYYTLREQIDNNGGLLNDESLHFIARHGLLCELLLCDNRLGEEAFLALPAVRAKGLFGRLDEGQFERIFINAYRAPENTELVAELQKRGWSFMDAVILDCPEIIPTLERMGADLEQSRYTVYLSK